MEKSSLCVRLIAVYHKKCRLTKQMRGDRIKQIFLAEGAIGMLQCNNNLNTLRSFGGSYAPFAAAL